MGAAGHGAQGTPGTPRVLRAMNDRAALDLLVSQGPLTRTQIGELTGLSKPTASQLLARLEAAGLVRTTGSVTGRPGPNAQLYEVDPTAARVAALALKEQLAQVLGMPIVIENDVNLAAVAERHDGAAQDFDDFVLVWVDEGVGAAIVLGGQLLRGATGGAGEIGYMPLPGAPLAR